MLGRRALLPASKEKSEWVACVGAWDPSWLGRGLRQEGFEQAGNSYLPPSSFHFPPLSPPARSPLRLAVSLPPPTFLPSFPPSLIPSSPLLLTCIEPSEAVSSPADGRGGEVLAPAPLRGAGRGVSFAGRGRAAAPPSLLRRLQEGEAATPAEGLLAGPAGDGRGQRRVTCQDLPGRTA